MRPRHITLVVALAFAAGCGGDQGTTTTPQRVVAKVTITGTVTTIQPGQAVQLIAAATDAAGAPIATPGTFVWSSSANAVATVDQNGKVTGVANGQVQISATISGIAGSYGLTVANPVPSEKIDTIFTVGRAFSPNFVTVQKGGSLVFALGFDGIGHDVQFATKTGSPAYIPVSTSKYFTVSFPSSGDFAFTCPTHPEMTGIVTVQ
ncbi:MAG: Ig-like domain-containing protein [Gemmatimonadota bacterium]